MSTTQPDTTTATQDQGAAAVAMTFEVTTLPVADVDRAKAFYQQLGWRLDIDFHPTPDTRAVQFTPPGSQASIQFGEGTTTMDRGPPMAIATARAATAPRARMVSAIRSAPASTRRIGPRAAPASVRSRAAAAAAPAASSAPRANRTFHVGSRLPCPADGFLLA